MKNQVVVGEVCKRYAEDLRKTWEQVFSEIFEKQHVTIIIIHAGYFKSEHLDRLLLTT